MERGLMKSFSLNTVLITLALSLIACGGAKEVVKTPDSVIVPKDTVAFVPPPPPPPLVDTKKKPPVTTPPTKSKKEQEFDALLKDASDKLAADKPDEALSLSRRALDINPKNALAADIAQKAVQKLKPKIKDLHRKGTDAYLKEDYDQAIAYFRKVLDIEPENKAALEYSERAAKKRDALQKLK